METGWLIEDGFSLRKLPPSQQVPVLLRTEWVFRNRLTFPSPEEQLRIYNECSFQGKWSPFIFSLFNFSLFGGGVEGLLPTDLKSQKDFNGFSLFKNFPLLFESQIKALLQVSYFRKCWVLLPSLRIEAELRSSQEAIKKIMEELNEKRIPFDRYLKVGVGIENLFSLRNLHGLLEGDFLIFDFDSIFSSLLGIPSRSLGIPEYLNLLKGELDSILRWLEPVPFYEKWCGFVSSLPPSKLGRLGELKWEGFFLRTFRENE